MYDNNDEEDGGFSLKMIPKPTAQALAQAAPAPQAQMPGSDVAARPQVDMGQLVARAGDDRKQAALGWEDALRQRIGAPIEDAIQGFAKRAFGEETKPTKDVHGLRSVTAYPKGEELYEAVQRRRRENMANGREDLSPEDMQYFQELRSQMLGKKGG